MRDEEAEVRKTSLLSLQYVHVALELDLVVAHSEQQPKPSLSGAVLLCRVYLSVLYCVEWITNSIYVLSGLYL